MMKYFGKLFHFAPPLGQSETPFGAKWNGWPFDLQYFEEGYEWLLFKRTFQPEHLGEKNSKFGFLGAKLLRFENLKFHRLWRRHFLMKTTTTKLREFQFFRKWKVFATKRCLIDLISQLTRIFGDNWSEIELLLNKTGKNIDFCTENKVFHFAPLYVFHFAPNYRCLNFQLISPSLWWYNSLRNLLKLPRNTT